MLAIKKKKSLKLLKEYLQGIMRIKMVEGEKVYRMLISSPVKNDLCVRLEKEVGRRSIDSNQEEPVLGFRGVSFGQIIARINFNEGNLVFSKERRRGRGQGRGRGQHGVLLYIRVEDRVRSSRVNYSISFVSRYSRRVHRYRFHAWQLPTDRKILPFSRKPIENFVN